MRVFSCSSCPYLSPPPSWLVFSHLPCVTLTKQEQDGRSPHLSHGGLCFSSFSVYRISTGHCKATRRSSSESAAQLFAAADSRPFVGPPLPRLRPAGAGRCPPPLAWRRGAAG